MRTFNSALTPLKYPLAKFTGRFGVILDRDGTINFDRGYTHKIEDLAFLPMLFESLTQLANLGAEFFIASNQSGIGRRYFSKPDMENFNERIVSEFVKKGLKICAIYVCPHLPSTDEACLCRKPLPGLLNAISRDYGLGAENTWMVGNTASDVSAGLSAGMNSFMIKSTTDWDLLVNAIRESLV